MGKSTSSQSSTTKTVKSFLPNPFPGLRPFNPDEAKYFFGREKLAEELISQLTSNNFIGLIGANSSGKTSFLNCSIIPHFIQKEKNSLLYFKPGNTPLENYLTALNIETKEIPEIKKRIIENNKVGVEIFNQYQEKSKQKVLLVIDQIEELFRYKANDKDISIFFDIILGIFDKKDIQVNIILSIRSEYMGEVARYTELTSLVNKSNLLLPQIENTKLIDIITNPIKLNKADIDEKLVQSIIESIQKNQYGLPVLQHTLMRTWAYWTENKHGDEAISLLHFEAIGGLDTSIEKHTSELFESLNDEQKIACEKIFKAITEVGSGDSIHRKPVTLKKIINVTNIAEKEVIHVIETFCAQETSILTPYAATSLSQETYIDIANESILRHWPGLANWVSEEARSVQMYKRLAEAAAMYQTGETSLWQPPDLQIALDWKHEQNPTLKWAEQYDPSFERAMVFLETSQKEYNLQEENKREIQKRTLRRARVVSIILGTAAVISILFMVYAFYLQGEAEKQRLLALEQKAKAEESEQKAKESEQKAKEQELIAISNADEAKRNAEEAKKNADEAERQALIAQQNEAAALKAQKLAIENAKEADRQKTIALDERDRADALRKLAIAKSNAVKSNQITDDKELKALLAKQSYNYNTQYGGKELDPDVYSALYFALKALETPDYNLLKGHTESVRSLVFHPITGDLYSTGANSQILSWDLKNPGAIKSELVQNQYINRILAISNDGKWLACGDEGKNIELYDLSQPNKEPKMLKAHSGTVWALVFTSDNQELISAGEDKQVMVWDLSSFNNKVIYKGEEWINSLNASSDGKYIAGSTNKGRIFLWAKGNNYQQSTFFENTDKSNIQYVTFSPNGKLITAGDIKGGVKVWEVASPKKAPISFGGQTAEIMQIKFNKDGKHLASASRDGSVRLWNIETPEELPVILKDEGSWVLCLSFSPDGDYLVVGDKQSTIRIWPTNLKLMANKVCDKLPRNMTLKEWELYVAENIPYEKICPSIK